MNYFKDRKMCLKNDHSISKYSVPLFGKEGLGQILLNKFPFFKWEGEQLHILWGDNATK